MKKIRDIDCYQ